MRLIDADEFEKRIKPYDTEDNIDKALYNFAHYHLITTPSAQPTQSNDSNTLNALDCISRQAAIDAADKIIERDTSGSNVVVNAMIAWSEYIRTLPPAEVPDCKCCKFKKAIKEIERLSHISENVKVVPVPKKTLGKDAAIYILDESYGGADMRGEQE